MGGVRVAVALGNQDLDRVAKQLRAREPEQRLGLAIDEHDTAEVVDDHHGIGRGFDELAEELVGR
jgi:hypothetical protein